MASSSNNSATSSQIQNSGSEGDLQQMMDERKRKRMASNRESARRSRMRKQKHIEDLMVQVDQLKRGNNQILQTTNLTTQQFVNVEAENSVLKAQMNELNQRLQSLNDILNYMNTLTTGVNGNGHGNGNGNTAFEDDSLDIFSHDDLGDFGVINGYYGNFTHNTNNVIIGANNPWNLGYLNQPIMASADVLQY
ncbi:bZIP transcription factor 11-like [Chenopodium quinoa]|uniref:bZIP transcription factor 11-like n=1 Tax=Chenopodium quinoa TaxID=63459 RepID=UPI000B791A9D|nr:bZIP transcription factor 11-like [Chenopodium quinoa]